MDLVGNNVDTLYEEIEHLVGHLVGNDVDTLHEKTIHLVGFSFIKVYDIYARKLLSCAPCRLAKNGIYYPILLRGV